MQTRIGNYRIQKMYRMNQKLTIQIFYYIILFLFTFLRDKGHYGELCDWLTGSLDCSLIGWAGPPQAQPSQSESSHATLSANHRAPHSDPYLSTVKYKVIVVIIFTGNFMHILLDSVVTSWKIMMSHIHYLVYS